jgi:hypothetical protein
MGALLPDGLLLVFTRAVLARWESGRAHVIGKLERRSAQPPTFWGSLAVWYYLGIRCNGLRIESSQGTSLVGDYRKDV